MTSIEPVREDWQALAVQHGHTQTWAETQGWRDGFHDGYAGYSMTVGCMFNIPFYWAGWEAGCIAWRVDNGR